MKKDDRGGEKQEEKSEKNVTRERKMVTKIANTYTPSQTHTCLMIISKLPSCCWLTTHETPPWKAIAMNVLCVSRWC